MYCTDERITNICGEIFRLLRTGAKQGQVNDNDISIRQAKTGTRTGVVSFGTMSIEVHWIPRRYLEDGTPRGSDEGANVFMIYPFRDDKGNMLRIPCYYSEREREPKLTCTPPDNMSAPATSGVKRVVKKYEPITTAGY